MFKERSNAKTEITYAGGEPSIYIAPIALDKMALYVQGCDKEIGWLGKVRKMEGNIFCIDDVYLFEQEVHSATCELTPEGLSAFVLDMYTNHAQDADEVLSNLRLWGHSHVNMGVSPSGQDETQLDSFKENNPWFVRVIANKSGEMEFTITDFTLGIKFKNVKWVEYREHEFNLEEQIKAEIALKVKNKTYTVVSSASSYVDRNWDYKKGEWVNKEPKVESAKNVSKKGKKLNESLGGYDDAGYYDYAYGNEYAHYQELESSYNKDLIERDKVGDITDEFMSENFNDVELKAIAKCKDVNAVSDLLENMDTFNIYNAMDVLNIYDFALGEVHSSVVNKLS